MNVQKAYEIFKKLVDEGHGDAVLVHCDTRSGVTENCHVSSSVEFLTGNEIDFYGDVEIGEKYLNVYDGS